MPYLQSNIPYFKAWVRREYTCNLERYHGEFLHCMVIAVTTMPNRCLSFQVIFTGCESDDTDENPKDTVSIKFATVADAKATIAKIKRINKPYARKIQILTVMEQRAKVMGKTEVVRLAKQAKLQLKKQKEKENA